MLKKLSIWMFFILLTGVAAAQSDAGKIKGEVKDETGAPVEFATVVILSEGMIKGGANTNENGEYSIAPVSPGEYEVRASFAGNTILVKGVKVAPNKTVEVPLKIEANGHIDE